MGARVSRWGAIALAASLWAAATVSGCVGSIGSSGDDVVDPPTPPLGEDFVPGAATIHVLTSRQLTNAYAAVFGDLAGVQLDLPSDDQLYGFTSIAAASRTISPVEAEKLEAAAYAVLDVVWQDDARREAFVGCTPSAMSDPCVRDFVATQGRRIWRRPLESSEIDALLEVGVGVESSTGNTWDALRYVVAATLQSPHFVFRVEIGVPDEASGLRKFTGWEMASRLSFILQDAPPDDALLDAAEAGELDTAEGARAQAERLIHASQARPALVGFFRDFMNINRLGDLDKSPDMFPMFSATLGLSMREELERLFEAKVFDRGGDFRELFTTRDTFLNEELAALYGVSGITGSGFVPATLPDDGQRAGLLTTAGFLAMNAHKTATSPTHRGRFVRISLLCQDIPPPPPGVNTTLDPDTSSGPQTLRERLEKHRDDAACRACHDLMDPIGFAFENYDAIGVWRDLDNGLPVDATSEVEGTPIDGAVAMSELVKEMPAVAACVARRFYQHANGRLDIKTERAAVDQLATEFVSHDHDFLELVLALVINDGFRYAGEEVAP